MIRALLLGLLLLVLAGCGSGDGAVGAAAAPPATRAQAPADPVTALLERRAAALQAGDAAAYARTGAGPQRRRDRRVGERAGRLPLEFVSLQRTSVTEAGETARARVVLAYRLRGVPGTFATGRKLVLRRGAGGWLVAQDRGARERAPWEVATYRVRARRGLRALLPAGLEARGLLRALQRARARVARLLPVPGRVLAVVARDAGAARRLTARIRGVDRLTAIAELDVRGAGTERAVVARRLVLVWSRFARLDARARARVLAHELTHLALAEQTSPRTPAWLLEGVALWASGDDRRAQAARVLRDPGALPGLSRADRRRALSLAGLARPDAIARLSGLPQAVAYAYSSAAAHHIVARHGPRRLLELNAGFAQGDASADEVVRRVLGRSLRGLERDLRRSLRSL